MQTDIVVVGAGPAGLSLVRALSGSALERGAGGAQ